MSLKDNLLKFVDNIHSTKFWGEQIHYKLFKSSHRAMLKGLDETEQDAMIFALCVCEEDGTPVYTKDDINDVLNLPSKIVTHVVMKAIATDEKKR